MLKKLLHSASGSQSKLTGLRPEAFLSLVLLMFGTVGARTEYAIPASRRIDWYPAGLDVVGGIPASFARTNVITGLHPDGSVDDTATINNALAAASPSTVLTIPAGTYKITGRILMKNGVVLRGAKPCVSPWLPAVDASATTLLMGNGSIVLFDGGSKDTSWAPGIQSGISITAGYAQGSTNLGLTSASTLAVGDYVAVYQNKDTAWIDDRGDTWLGEDSGPDPHVWAQYAKITAKNGNTITIEPPLYQVTPSPTGQSVRKQTFSIAMSGLENMRLYGDATNIKLIWFRFCRNCWVSGVESYNVGSDGSGSPHIWTEFCYANEYRRNYHHHGASNDSGRNYGVEFYHWNSRHKVENNIVRDIRHSIIFEGGGSGCVILYNYTDDNWESVQGSGATPDNQILTEDIVANHGAHPYMNLWEGNASSSWWGDYTQGSSSHNILLRNSLSGRRTTMPLSNPWSWTVVEIENYNRYYTLLGNVLGNPTMSGGTVILNSASSAALPLIYRFGYTSSGGSYADSQAFSTAILHGNYDFVSKSVHDWAGTDHAIPVSLYYTNYAKPSWFGDRNWPPFDNTKVTAGQIDPTNTPAGYRFVYGIDPPTGNQAPVVVASASSTNGPAPITVSFSSAGSYDPEGVSLTYSWRFGDGAVSSSANPSHTYLAPGTYNAQLSVSDGVNTTLSGVIRVVASIAGSNQPPVAVATANPTVGSAPLTVLFSSSGSYDPEGAALTYNWTFGDGGTSTLANPSHIYQGAGVYQARLQTSDGTNSTLSSILTISVTNPPPTVGLTSPGSGASYNAPATVNLSASVGANGHAITKVQFYSGTVLLGEAGIAPYSWTWNSVGAGSYSLFARLVYDSGNTVDSAPVNILVGGLVAAYGFEEGSGTQVMDASGNGNTGTITGASWAQGKYGKALNFNGLDNVVTVSSSASLNVSSAMTLEAWVYPTSAQTNWHSVIHRESDAYYISTSSPVGDMVPAGGATIGGTERYTGGTAALPLNTWTHLTATYNGATLAFYFNGQLVSSLSLSGSVQTNSNPLRIGGNSYAGQFFQGLIDEVRIYNRALSAPEIQADMNSSIDSRPSPPTGLHVAGQ